MKARTAIAFLLLATAAIPGCLTADTAGDTLRTGLEAHVAYLASDSLEGRFVGTPGIARAGRYIAEEFENIGLEPAFGGSYFQDFRIELGFELEGPPLLTIGGSELEPGKDFAVLPFSGSGSVDGRTAAWSAEDSAGGDRVFLVVVDAAREEKRWTMTGRDGLLEWMRDTAIRCSAEGASAVVFVSGSPERTGASLHRFMIPRTYSPIDVPAVEIVYDALAGAVMSGGISMDRVTTVETDGTRSLEIVPAPECTVRVAARQGSVEVRNIGGLLRGRGPGYVVTGAHYDHLGRGDIGSSTPWRHEIHPGADDNASGVAGVIEIARIIGSYGEPERSVIFLAFTAEELGALGSEYYCKEASKTIDSTVAMINLDCIGRLEEHRLIAFGARSAEEAGGLLAEAATGHKIEIIEKQEIYGFSDQNPFYARGIPSLHFFTGAHNDYHSPDDVPEKINFDGMVSVTSFVADFVSLLAFNRTELTPVVVKPQAEEKLSRGEGAHLGIVPDFAYAGTGVGIKGTVPESPARRAGLEDGDVIVGIDNQPIADLRALMRFLTESSPGDSIEIQIMRASVVKTFGAVLSVRSSRGHSD